MRRIFFILFLLILAMSIVQPLSAEDITFEAEVNAPQVALDDSLQLTLKITGTQDVIPIELPEINGFTSRFIGPATHVAIINGQSSVTKSFIYALYPQQKGKFTIPGLTITIAGKDFASAPIEVEVVDAVAAPSPAGSPAQNQALTNLSDKIFMIMGTPEKEAYLGEKVPLTIKLFVTGVSASDIEYPEFAHDGFSVDDFEKPKQYQQMIGGLRYDVLEFKTHIYPSRIGELILGPAKIRCQILTKSKRRAVGPDSRFADFFDSDLFEGFLDTFERRPASLESTDLSLVVYPLPENGKPETFTGGIGQFEFDATVSPAEVRVGDPVTVRMKIKGENLKAVSFPAIKPQDGLKLYDPQVREEGGEKILEQVVIPTDDKVAQLPEIAFSYFDKASKTYQTVVKGPFPLKVLKSQGQESKIIGLQEFIPEKRAEQFGRDIVFIKERSDAFRPVGKRLYDNIFIRLSGIGVVALWVLLYVVYRETHRLRTDQVYARRLRAPKKAQAGMLSAKALIQKGREKEFYDVIFKTLQEYLGDKFHLSSSGLTFVAVDEVLSSQGIAPEMIGRIKVIFEDCDMVRYASASFDAGKMRGSLESLEKVIDHLERNIR